MSLAQVQKSRDFFFFFYHCVPKKSAFSEYARHFYEYFYTRRELFMTFKSLNSGENVKIKTTPTVN